MKYEAIIERMNHNGEGIAIINNKITFISKTITNDKVLVEITEQNKNYNRAKVINYIERGENYIKELCPYYHKCGGCNISNLEYNKQLDYKRKRCIDIFKRYTEIDINPNIIPSDNIYTYRNKIKLQVKDNKIGLYNNLSNDLIEIDNCLLVSDKVNNLIKDIKKIDLRNIKDITIKESPQELLIYINGIIKEKDIKHLEKADNIVANNKIIKGKGYITQSINETKYIVSPDSFYQVNNNTVRKLYDKVLEYISPKKTDNIIDLYCGTGTIGLYIAKYCNKVTGIEINKNAIKDANKNKKINRINNIDFICGDVGKIINNKYKADTIIVDPPRSGLDKNTKKVLLEILPTKIIYVSCDTLTLSRDLKELLTKYTLKDITLVDMFPQTYHVEVCCCLSLK